MIWLALEFSGPRRSVAVLDYPVSAPGMRMVASRSDVSGDHRNIGPLALVEAVLGEARLSPDSVERLVVGLGPGSYTGIRSAIALAQGWHLARGIEIYG